MIIELYTMILEAEALQVKLGSTVELDSALVTIEFTVSGYRPATFYEPEEGSEINVEAMTIVCLTDMNGDVVDITDEQRLVIVDHLDYSEFDDHCYTAWSDRDRDDY